MKLSNLHEDMTKPTAQMVRNFEVRTAKHIDLVGAALHKVAAKTGQQELVARATIHDASKYGPAEREPYIWLTEYHRCNNEGLPFEYPSGIEQEVKSATKHHVTTNRHHPEFHARLEDMTEIDIIEMVCDWTAMAQELGQGGGSARGWADKNVGPRWNFLPGQEQLIYNTIGMLEE